jgi:hypothetical protein
VAPIQVAGVTDEGWRARGTCSKAAGRGGGRERGWEEGLRRARARSVQPGGKVSKGPVGRVRTEKEMGRDEDG